MRHRTDIDGLRCVAVLPIVIFHAGIGAIPGGFVGVDIFFVISGFLITGILLKQIDQNIFRITEFYRRRAVRILPALVALLLTSMLAGYAFLLPQELKDLGRSAAASAGFVANVYFWASADYFSASADTIPLLHLWSLGVEEQFYIFYPLFLFLIYKISKNILIPSLYFFLFVSISFCFYLTFYYPQAAFYILPSRAWELALGGLAAAGAFPKIGRRENLIAIAGLTFIAISLFAIREDMAFPAPWALLPCFGTALVLVYGSNTSADRLLSQPVAAFVGKISYSLYLWHWPIITFYRIEFGSDLSFVESFALIIASLAAAVFSYYAIERPFLSRYRNANHPTFRVLSIAAITLATVGGVGLLISTTRGLIQMRHPDIAAITDYGDYRTRKDYRYQFRRGTCFRGENENGVPFQPDVCLRLLSEKPNVVVLGDSHAAQYWRAFNLKYPSLNVLQGTASGCRPLLHGQGEARCKQVVDYVLGPLLSSGRVKQVILAARWKPEELKLLGPTITHIRRSHTDVVVIGPIIEYQGEFPSLLARATITGNPHSVDKLHVRGREELDREMRKVTLAAGARYVSVQEILCRPEGCVLFAPDGAPMHFDYGHLTLSGSRWVVDQMPIDLVTPQTAQSDPSSTAPSRPPTAP